MTTGDKNTAVIYSGTNVLRVKNTVVNYQCNVI